jgi:putative membrane protein
VSGGMLFELSMWNWEPSVIAGVALLSVAYLGAISPLRAKFHITQKVGLATITWFLLGMLVILFALVSPLDSLSDHYLFSAHMLQHVLLTLVAPPLLLLGTPAWFFKPVLRRPGLRAVAHALTNPPLAFILFNVTFLLWHIPVAYEAALNNELVHLIEHLCFMGTAILFWWPILSPLDELPRLPYPGQILYLFLAAVPSTILGALIIFTPSILYPTYVIAPRINGFSPMADQQIAGMIMAMPASMIYLGVMGGVFFAWLNREEHLGMTT